MAGPSPTNSHLRRPWNSNLLPRPWVSLVVWVYSSRFRAVYAQFGLDAGRRIAQIDDRRAQRGTVGENAVRGSERAVTKE